MISFMIVLLEFSKLRMRNYFRYSDSNFMNLLINKLSQTHCKPPKIAEYELKLLSEILFILPFSNESECTMSPVLVLGFSAKLRARESAQCPPLCRYQLVLID